MFVVHKKKYNKKFFRRHGYKVTEKPLGMSPPEEQECQEDAYEKATEGDASNRLILEGYVERYPQNPRFKSHLYTFYKVMGDDIEAKKIALRTLNQHPDYLFSRLNLADICIIEGNYETANKMLGEPRRIETIAPDREIFHISEFLSYHSMSVAYGMQTDDRDAAEEHFAMMIDLAPENHLTRNTALYMMDKAALLVKNKVEKAKEASIAPNNFPTYTPEPTKVAPKLNHDELEALYIHAEEELPKELMEDILQLPRKTLIADLENILEDSIRRYKYFYDKYVEFDETEQSFPIHALRFLGALEAHESIETVLNVLRQGEAFLEYWFADMLHNYVGDTLLIMGKHQLEALKAYTLESHQFCLARSHVFEAITQVALHDSNRQDEVVQICKEIFDYHLQHADDKTITSTDFISWAMCHATDIRDESWMEYIDKFDEKGWMIHFITGTMENLKKDVQSPPEPADANPLPRNIHEFYNQRHHKRRAKYNNTKDIMSKTSEKVVKYFVNITAEAMLMEKLEESGILDLMAEYDDDDNLSLNPMSSPNYLNPGFSRQHEYQEPLVREDSKVGRNDPCPCGSGKKHKKCCLRKAS